MQDNLPTYILQIDKNDKVINKVTHLDAHKQGLLHRSCAIALMYQNYIVMQLVKSDLFDGHINLTSSSHPQFDEENEQGMLKSIYRSLQDEWGILQKDLFYAPKSKGTVYYKSIDTISKLIEHEICHVFVSGVNELPALNLNHSYGYILLTKDQLYNTDFPPHKLFAPWVREILKQRII
jgi:isopentenyldiphosphate isomerase